MYTECEYTLTLRGPVIACKMNEAPAQVGCSEENPDYVAIMALHEAGELEIANLPSKEEPKE